MPKKIDECLTWGKQKLGSSKADAPDLSAEVLLAHVLNCTRLSLFINKNKSVSTEAFKAYRVLVLRRARGEPLSYLLGKKEFYSREFAVSSQVLIPRPETELIIDHALSLIPREKKITFLDVGAGSGVLGVTLALEFPRARGILIDIDRKALEVAQKNVSLYGLDKRLLLFQGDLLECVKDESCFLIVANPPYVTPGEFVNLDIGVRGYEPSVALVGNGADGLGHVFALLREMPKKLVPGGYALIEIGACQGNKVAYFLASKNEKKGIWWKLEKDYAGLDRVIILRKACDF